MRTGARVIRRSVAIAPPARDSNARFRTPRTRLRGPDVALTRRRFLRMAEAHERATPRVATTARLVAVRLRAA